MFSFHFILLLSGFLCVKGRAANDTLLSYIRASEIGRDQVIQGPFGQRALTYVDYVASGRALTFIEDYIRSRVLPMYANTHTETSATGRQMSHLRQEARQIIQNAVHADHAKDVVLFTGSGSTAAINMLIRSLTQKLNFRKACVFIGPYEHHSNEVSWRETGALVIRVRAGQRGKGGVDLEHLESLLQNHCSGFIMKKTCIGSFSAASNINGILTDSIQVTDLLKSYKVLAFWDYAAAAPYVPIDMNPQGHAAKDAIFISTHKFVGAPGTPGLLIAKRSLFEKVHVPSRPGGGTVQFVTNKRHIYLKELEEREEGGTPDIIGSIRAGLAFQLKEAVGSSVIQSIETNMAKRVMQEWGKHENLVILGDPDATRLPTLSFLIRFKSLFLHPNFVATLLNDLFGIQARSGCACAAPYGSELLGIDDKVMAILMKLSKDYSGLKPGFTRLNFPFFLDAETEQFLTRAVLLIAEHGWRFLPLYKHDLRTGRFTFHKQDGFPATAAFSLADISYESGKLNDADMVTYQETVSKDQYFEKAYALMMHSDDFKIQKTQQLAQADDPRTILLKGVASKLGLNHWNQINRLLWFLTVEDTIDQETGQRESAFVPKFCDSCDWKPMQNLNNLRIGSTADARTYNWGRKSIFMKATNA